MKLNIGAGGNLRSAGEGWINIDARKLDGIDLVLDLGIENFPYEDNTVDEVNMQDFLEHLNRFRQKSFLRDLRRVMKPGAKAFIQIPDLGVIAQRYCGVLENPTSHQHGFDGEGLASALYGGQDYAENFHKWGYDYRSLDKVLVETGFVPRDIHSDGGSNLLCLTVKPYNKILLPVGGGIGDVIQVYLSSPASRGAYENNNVRPPDEFPTSNIDGSLWLKRLRMLKSQYPNVKVKIVVVSANASAAEIFNHHPYIDAVEVLTPGSEPDWYRYIDAEGYMHIEGTEYIYDRFDPDPVQFYVDEIEAQLCDSAGNLGKYIVLHPFAGAQERIVLSHGFCRKLVDRLIDDLGYHIVVVGKQCVLDGQLKLLESFPYQREGLTSLVNKISVNASAQIILGASGFIGMHSCMVLCAWYARIPTVCLVPPYHDGGQTWEEFFADEINPTTWGDRQSFNRTIIVPERDNVDLDEVIENLMEAGLSGV